LTKDFEIKKTKNSNFHQKMVKIDFFPFLLVQFWEKISIFGAQIQSFDTFLG